MEPIALIGYLAATCTTASFIPQVVRILRTGEVNGISLTMYSIFTFGVACWLAYGLYLEDWPMIIANVITLILAGSVLLLTLRHHVVQKANLDNPPLDNHPASPNKKA